MKLVWSNTARNDLKQLNTYIGQNSPIYARQFIQRILAHAETLPSFPNLGRYVTEANRDDIREIVFQGYRIIYQTAANHVLIDGRGAFSNGGYAPRSRSPLVARHSLSHDFKHDLRAVCRRLANPSTVVAIELEPKGFTADLDAKFIS